MLNTLLAWDGDYTRTAADGKVEPGVATWEAFKAAAQVVALGEPTPATRALVGTPGDEGFVESTLGETYALRTLDAEGCRRAAANAAAALTARFGSADPATWRDDARDGQRRGPGPGDPAADPAAEPRHLRAGGGARAVRCRTVISPLANSS